MQGHLFVSLFAFSVLTFSAHLSAAEDPRDLSGAWQAFARVPADAAPELSAEGEVLVADFNARYPNPVDPEAYCLPLGMPAMMTEVPGMPIDIVQSFGRLAVLGPDGRARTVRIGAHEFVEDAPGTRMGISIGHWENDTLVIETRGLDAALTGPWPRTENMNITERVTRTTRGRLGITPTDPARDVTADTPVLEIALTITDPGLYREAASVTVYYRPLGAELALEYACATELWQQALDAANQ